MSLIKDVWGYFRKRKGQTAEADRASQLYKTYTDLRAQVWNFPTEPEIIAYPQNGAQLKNMVWRVPVIRTCIDNLMMQHYRKNPLLKPKFISKCPICGAEYQETKEYCDDPNCVMQGAKNLPPNPAQKQVYEKWKGRVNRNNRDHVTVCKEFTYEAHISDNPWRLYTFDYKLEPLTNTLNKRLIELTIPPPDSMRLIQDQYGIPGNLYWTCIFHRNVLKGEKEKEMGCPECGQPLYNVTACSVKRASQGNVMNTEDIDVPYIEGEWLHAPYYTPTENYGISPVYTCWMLGSSLHHMDNLELNTYKMGRPPKSLTVFNSFNVETIKSQIKSEFTAAKENRNYPPILVMPTDGKGKMVEVINMMPTDDEIKNLDHRKDIRDRIGAVFGVQPIFQADASSGGGLNNEGQQLTVTLIRQETLHRWEEKVFDSDFDALGITDWVLRYGPLKEEDRMAVEMRKKENLQMIGMLRDRGADYIITDPEDWEFKIVGHIGSLANNGAGQMGAGFKEMGGGLQGWDMRDWMKQDSSFAFSLKKDDAVKQMIQEFMVQLNIIMSYSHDSRLKAFDIISHDLLREFYEYLKLNLARYVRIGLDLAGYDYDSAIIDADKMRALMDAYDFNIDSDFFTPVMQIIDSAKGALSLEILESLQSYLTTELENVLDTESTAFVNAGIAEGYRLSDPDDLDYDYSWVGPDFTQGRSTLVCQAIKERFDSVRRKNGRVSLADAQQIVAEEGSKSHGKEKAFNLGRSWVPHYRCRHRLLGSPVLHKSVVYIRDRSEAPPGATVYEGPNGGLYYETGHGDGAGDGNEEESGPAPDKTTDGVSGDGNSSGGNGQFTAVGLRRGDGKWDFKFYDPADRGRIEQLLLDQGYSLGDEVIVTMVEAIPEGGGAE